MKKWLVGLINKTFGKVSQFKLIKVGDTIIKINTKPELDVKRIKEDFPNGLPA